MKLSDTVFSVGKDLCQCVVSFLVFFFLTKNSRFVVDLKLSKLNQAKVPLLFFPVLLLCVCKTVE